MRDVALSPKRGWHAFRGLVNTFYESIVANIQARATLHPVSVCTRAREWERERKREEAGGARGEGGGVRMHFFCTESVIKRLAERHISALECFDKVGC